MKTSGKKALVALIYALVIGILHHVFHGGIQPLINKVGFFSKLPKIFLGSTSVVTLFIILLTFFGGWILLSINFKSKGRNH